jgi:hypothetical protein
MSPLAFDVWIGVVGVRPLPGNTRLEGAEGAYVNALAFVSNAADYELVVTRALREVEFSVFEFDDVETFADRVKKATIEQGLEELASIVRRTGRVQFGIFHRFRDAPD